MGELTPATWDDAVAGKTVFIKFFASWCGHCKKMKPDWDKLMKEFEGHKTILVADVECSNDEGKPLCDSNGVKGFPTIKHGDPANMEDYKGGRDFKALQSFAKDLKPVCSPSNIDLCDEEGKAKIAKIEAMSDAELADAIAAADNKVKAAEELFKTEVEKLQKKYQQLQEDQENTLAEVKESGVGLLKAVSAARKNKPAKEEL